MRTILTLLAGLILGGALVYFLFVGAPRAKPLTGAPVTAPDPAGDPPGTVLITLDQKFFDAVLGTIFRDLGAPTFQLAANEAIAPANSAEFRPIALQSNGCGNTIVLAPEGSNNVNTGVRFAEGKIMTPLAFSGSYNVFGNCVNFRGWAQANIQLSFDQANQKLFGQINVEGVNLDGTMPIVGGVITPLVQRSINERVNPLQFLSAQQLKLSVPVQASNGVLNSQVKDIRAEVLENALRLHITYEFSGAGGQPQPQG